MSRRMIDPQVIIKSQVVDDKIVVDLNEILEKHGVQLANGSKTVTLQIYSKEVSDDNYMAIDSDTGVKAAIVINTAITITKNNNTVIIRGLLVDNLNDMNFLSYIEILGGDYENGIILSDHYLFDVHVIKI